MITDMKIKVLIWFWYLESMEWINETKKATRYVQYQFTLSKYKMLILTHTEDTNTMSTVYTTQDYEYRHENKGTGFCA